LILPWDIVSYVPALAPQILRGIGEAMRCTTPGRLVLVKEQAEFFDIDLSGIQEAEGQGSRLPEIDHFHHPNLASKSSSSMSDKGWVLYRYTRAPNTQYCWSRAFRRCNICFISSRVGDSVSFISMNLDWFVPAHGFSNGMILENGSKVL
jgi:hypothetical protein